MGFVEVTLERAFGPPKPFKCNRTSRKSDCTDPIGARRCIAEDRDPLLRIRHTWRPFLTGEAL